MLSSTISGNCRLCNSELYGTVVEVAGNHYHNRCFYCCACRKQLSTDSFRMRDDRFYCIDCYSEAFERVCAECENYITDDKYIEAMGKFYHCDHFVCFLCKKPFKDSKYVRKEILYNGEQFQRPFCLDCNKKTKYLPCTKCGHLMGEVRAYDGKDFYHDFCYLEEHPEIDLDGSMLQQAKERRVTEGPLLEGREAALRRQTELEELKRQAEEEEKRRRQAEEEERKRQEEEERRQREEEERKRQEEEEAERRRREEEERRRQEEEEERKRREAEEEEERKRRAEEEERKRKEEEEERKKLEETERQQILEERQERRERHRRMSESAAQRQVEHSQRQKEERQRREEESQEKKKRREEERKRRDEDRKRREEARKAREEEERKAKEERERKQREKREEREMLELYKTKQRMVNFNDSDEDLPREKEEPRQGKRESTMPPAPAPPDMVRKVSGDGSGFSVLDQLRDSYMPMQGNRVEKEEAQGELAKSTLFENPQYGDYQQKNRESVLGALSEEEEEQKKEEKEKPEVIDDGEEGEKEEEKEEKEEKDAKPEEVSSEGEKEEKEEKDAKPEEVSSEEEKEEKDAKPEEPINDEAAGEKAPVGEEKKEESDQPGNKVLEYDVDEEYEKEQKRVQSLPDDQLKTYSLAVLTTPPYPKDVDPKRRELHLSDEEFEKVFNMTKEKFKSQPKWKCNQLRKAHHLF